VAGRRTGLGSSPRSCPTLGLTPFLLHRPASAEPSKLTENDARRVVRENFDSSEMQSNVWSKLLKGEKVWVKQGQLEWTSDATA
jgi:hypothetical protein